MSDGMNETLPEGISTKEVQKNADPKALFSADRGERAAYFAADLKAEVFLPLTRDGFEALIERATGQFSPPLPIDNSVRKVLHGWIHHIENTTNTCTIEGIGKVLWKSIANAMTWTLDQEIKMKEQEERTQALALEAKKREEEQRQARIERKELQQAKKAGRRMTVASKPSDEKTS